MDDEDAVLLTDALATWWHGVLGCQKGAAAPSPLTGAHSQRRGEAHTAGKC
ncbi:hypothetical protein [Actinocrispum sp. NPDC049592]|uniref:hypothetical protein n=1 Tax=Actinocrispum sp. NPDC049592 TaxID=3154835 RepID=UPI00342A7E88